MALTDEQLQVLHGEVADKCKKDASNTIIDDKTGQEYKIIHKTDSTTQAIAVAPIKYDTNGKEYVDYSQTAIAVAGTQPIVNDSVLNSI